MSVSEVRALLARHGLAPRRELGQNFLHDDELAQKLVRTASVGARDAVLEIGAGTGVLTRALAARARRVHSIEIDAGLVRALHAERTLPANVELQHADARKLDLPRLCQTLGAPLRVVANLPYSAATPLLRKLLDTAPLLQSWSVMVQREVAERLRAAPRTRAYTSLTILHEWLTEPGEVLHLQSQCFYPAPKVTSSFVTLYPRAQPTVTPTELASFERVLRAGFLHRRKTLVNALARAGVPTSESRAVLRGLGLGERVRAEELGAGVWGEVVRLVSAGREEE